MLSKVLDILSKDRRYVDVNGAVTAMLSYPNTIPPILRNDMISPYVLALAALSNSWEAITQRRGGDVKMVACRYILDMYGEDGGIKRSDADLAALVRHSVGTHPNLRNDGAWQMWENIDKALKCVNAGEEVLFSNWVSMIEEGHRCGVVYGLFWDKLITPHNWPKYSSDIGYVMAWNIDQIDTTHPLWNTKLGPGIGEYIWPRITNRFGEDPSKFTWNFSDWNLLLPVAMSILRDKEVDVSYRQYLYKWVFRRDWATEWMLPQYKLVLKAITKNFEEYRECIMQWKKYRRSHMIEWLASVYRSYPDSLSLTRSQLGDIAPQIIKLAIKKDGYRHLTPIIERM